MNRLGSLGVGSGDLVGLALGLSALQSELNIDAGNNDRNDGADDAEHGSCGHGDATAVSSVDPRDGGNARDHGHRERAGSQGPRSAEQMPGNVAFLEDRASKRDEGEHRHEHRDAGIGENRADSGNRQKNQVRALRTDLAHDCLRDGLRSTRLVDVLAQNGRAHEDEQVLLNEACEARHIRRLRAEHCIGDAHAVRDRDNDGSHDGGDKNIPAFHGCNDEEDETDDDADNSNPLHVAFPFRKAG